MAKKTEWETREKLQKLSRVIGTDDKSAEAFNEQESKRVYATAKPTFKTSEVVVLMIITIVVSLGLGAFFTTKLLSSSVQTSDDELQKFVESYQYIIDNYNGEVDKEELLDAALEAMLDKLDDNSVFLDGAEAKNFDINLEGQYEGVGIEVYNNDDGNITINRVFDNSPAYKAGLKVGDIITAYNTKDVKGVKTDEFVDMVSASKKKNFELTYLRGGMEYTVKLKVGEVELQSVSSKIYNQNKQKIGYLRVSIFASNTYKQFKEEFNELQKNDINSLIIDLRDNSGGYLSAAEDILSLFLDSSHPIFQIQKQGETTKYYSKGNKTLDVKIVVLVNGNSASASEVMASALQEQYKASLVGEKTYGKGTVQELQDLTDGNKYKLTTKNWLTSKGKWVDKKGIKPDIEVSLPENYQDNPTEKNDSQLQAAIKSLVG